MVTMAKDTLLVPEVVAARAVVDACKVQFLSTFLSFFFFFFFSFFVSFFLFLSFCFLCSFVFFICVSRKRACLVEFHSVSWWEAQPKGSETGRLQAKRCLLTFGAF